MTIESWLENSIKRLDYTSVPTARLDTEVLLADHIDKDRSWIHANPDFILQRSDLRRLDEQISRREKHEPLAYIRGKQEFYGRDFLVSLDTLTPRPETETMIDLLLKHIDSIVFKNEKIQIIDVGTGSGCIIISAALELAQSSKISYLGLDMSEPALEIAKKNAKKLDANVKFKNYNLLTDKLPRTSADKHRIIVANLPYVPNNFHINIAASHEPGFAIFGGKDGLDYYRLLFNKASKNTELILTESLPPQHEDLENIALKHNYSQIKTEGFIQVFSK
jgi:release factor glutamine methyltransferase